MTKQKFAINKSRTWVLKYNFAMNLMVNILLNLRNTSAPTGMRDRIYVSYIIKMFLVHIKERTSKFK